MDREMEIEVWRRRRRNKGGEVEEGRWGRIWIVGAGWGPREPIATHTHYTEHTPVS